MTTLVLPPRVKEDSDMLARAARRAGWDVERLPSWHIPPLLREEDIVLYAEPLFVLHAAPQLDLAMLEPPYDWLPSLPHAYLRRRVRFMTLGQARRLGNEQFIKPAMDKLFPAGIYADGESLPGRDVAPDVLPVLVSDVVGWKAEFRFFILNGVRVAGSPYWIDGRLAFTEAGGWSVDESLTLEAAAFVDELLREPKFRLPPGVVIDVGKLKPSGQWAVIEANPAWGSGIYGCDPDAVLQVVQRSCVKIDRLSAGERMWVIDHAAEDFTCRFARSLSPPEDEPGREGPSIGCHGVRYSAPRGAERRRSVQKRRTIERQMSLDPQPLIAFDVLVRGHELTFS